MTDELHPAEVEVVVPVGSGAEDVLLDETLNQFAQSMEGAPAEDATLLIVRSEYGASGLVKKVIFENAAPAARFRSMWTAAQTRLAHS